MPGSSYFTHFANRYLSELQCSVLYHRRRGGLTSSSSTAAATSAAASASAEGRIYFTRVTVRTFTKITTIWVRIIYSFTYCIVSVKDFLWSVFWTNNQSVCFMFVLRKTSAYCWDHIHTVARHGMKKAMEFTVIYTNACIESNVKTGCCATVHQMYLHVWNALDIITDTTSMG
jgi:hypothetical protein